MAWIIIALVVIITLISVLVSVHRRSLLREAMQHSISPEALYKLMRGNSPLLLFDVRVPLDLLAHSEIIVGAIRLPPHEVEGRAATIAKDVDIVIYGTCLDNNMLHLVVQLTRKLNFCRHKVLQGGFEDWKKKGLPIEAYTASFHLDTATQ